MPKKLFLFLISLMEMDIYIGQIRLQTKHVHVKVSFDQKTHNKLIIGVILLNI